MKARSLMFALINCAALMHASAYAASSIPWSRASASDSPATTISKPSNANRAASARKENRQMDGKTATAAPDHSRTSEKNHARGHVGVPATARPKQPLTNGEHTRSGRAINLHQPRPNRPSGVTSEGLIHNHGETPHHTQTVQPPNVVRTNAPSSSNVRHHGLNPALIGGPASLNTRGTSINGARMARRP